MRQLDALLFDMGGTLDGRGGWRDRFERLFAEAGVNRPRDERMRAFDYAEHRSHTGDCMLFAGLRQLVESHVAWQFEALRIDDGAIAHRVAERFIRDVETVAVANRRMLAALAAQGLKLGLVSNACGNAATLCAEYGYAPHLSVVIDSHRVGVAKPDAAIFQHALRALDTAAERAGFVGDSLDRDMKPAKALGMWTCWVADRALDPDSALYVDAVVEDVADLPTRLDLLCAY
jgi:HAD superfamily hydrolase (TIGR01509 family)